MSPGGGVLLLYGHGLFGASMARLAAAIRRAGYATLSPNYPYRRLLPAIVDWLAPRVEAFETGLGGPLHIVTHSLSGLVARALIADRRPSRLGRVVLLAPPNTGSELADLLFCLRLAPLVLGGSGAHLRTRRTVADEALLGKIDFPLGVIAGNRPLLPLPFISPPRPHDGKVSLTATHVPGLAEHLVLPVTHTLMVYDGRVIAATLAFIETSHFLIAASGVSCDERIGCVGFTYQQDTGVDRGRRSVDELRVTPN